MVSRTDRPARGVTVRTSRDMEGVSKQTEIRLRKLALEEPLVQSALAVFDQRGLHWHLEEALCPAINGLLEENETLRARFSPGATFNFEALMGKEIDDLILQRIAEVSRDL